jgi:AraC family transcriptional regulator
MINRPEAEMMQSSRAQPSRAERRRVSIHKSRVAEVEDAWLPPGWEIDPLCESAHQIIIPYHGLFTCSVGNQHSMFDVNSTLFIAPGKEYAVEHPLPGVGDGALIFTPSAELLDEACSAKKSSRDKVFANSSCPSTMPVRLMTQHLRLLISYSNDPLEFDEWVIRTIQEAMQSPAPRPERNCRSVVENAKEILHARSGKRVSLDGIAREVGVSPIYLTQEFTRQEGAPLYRYSQRLRLSRALAELPECEDITGLALDLGFSSHSHFTLAFRKAFGLTPSAYRAKIGSREMRISA